LKPKKLNLFEMWNLYNTLKSGIRKDRDTYLIDEVIYIMQMNNSFTIKKSIQIMYGDSKFDNPLDVALLFSKGLINNDFLAFVDVLEGLYANPDK